MASSIHIKLEYPEAVSLKREALLFEESLLKIIGKIRAYNALKKKEFALKSKIRKDLIALKNLVSSIETTLPKEEVKAIGEGYRTEEIKKEIKKETKVLREEGITKERKMSDIEKQLEEIRAKLARLG